MPDAEEIFERMQRTKSGWRPADFETLYLGFRFDRREGANHTVYTHPTYPELMVAAQLRV
jgi:hypothetical protein